MGSVSGKKLNATHRRTAGLDTAGSTITDAQQWCNHFAEDDADYARITELYAGCSDEEKTQINELFIDQSGDCFKGREHMVSHFAGLDGEDMQGIKDGLTSLFPNIGHE